MNTFKKKLIYYGKDILLTYVYVIVCSLIGIILSWATVAGLMEGFVCAMLSVVNMALYFIVITHSFMKTAEDAMRVKHSNDLERRTMLKERYYRELDKVSEYNPRKLIVYILPMIIPIVLLLVVAGILALCNVSTYAIEVMLKILYGFIYSFAFGIKEGASAYWTAFAIVLTIAPIVVGYVKGCNNVKKEYERVEKIKQVIDGDK